MADLPGGACSRISEEGEDALSRASEETKQASNVVCRPTLILKQNRQQHQSKMSSKGSKNSSSSHGSDGSHDARTASPPRLATATLARGTAVRRPATNAPKSSWLCGCMTLLQFSSRDSSPNDLEEEVGVDTDGAREDGRVRDNSPNDLEEEVGVDTDGAREDGRVLDEASAESRTIADPSAAPTAPTVPPSKAALSSYVQTLGPKELWDMLSDSQKAALAPTQSEETPRTSTGASIAVQPNPALTGDSLHSKPSAVVVPGGSGTSSRLSSDSPSVLTDDPNLSSIGAQLLPSAFLPVSRLDNDGSSTFGDSTAAPDATVVVVVEEEEDDEGDDDEDDNLNGTTSEGIFPNEALLASFDQEVDSEAWTETSHSTTYPASTIAATVTTAATTRSGNSGHGEDQKESP